MSTLNQPAGKKTTLVSSNPILRRMGKFSDRSDSNSASFGGIAAKTTFFLLVTLVGIAVQLIVMNSMANQPDQSTMQLFKKFTFTFTKTEIIALVAILIVGFICELVGIFVQRTVPVTGTVYSFSQGYVISFLVFKVLKGYEYLGLEALLLTVAVVAVMAWLYTSGIVKGGKTFNTILLTLIIASIGFGLLTFLGSLLPFSRDLVQGMMKNTGLMIALDVIGIVIAAMFLISDFTMVENCVRDHYPKKYEWYAAFGLVFTVLWIYLKILDLLMRVTGSSKNS